MFAFSLTSDDTKRVGHAGVSGDGVAVGSNRGGALRNSGANESESSSGGVHCD